MFVVFAEYGPRNRFAQWTDRTRSCKKRTLVDVHEAKTRFLALLERAHAGEEIILAKEGKPYAKLVPLEPNVARVPGRYRDTIPVDVVLPLPDAEIEAWER